MTPSGHRRWVRYWRFHRSEGSPAAAQALLMCEGGDPHMTPRTVLASLILFGVSAVGRSGSSQVREMKSFSWVDRARGGAASFAFAYVVTVVFVAAALAVTLGYIRSPRFIPHSSPSMPPLPRVLGTAAMARAGYPSCYRRSRSIISSCRHSIRWRRLLLTYRDSLLSSFARLSPMPSARARSGWRTLFGLLWMGSNGR